MTTEIGTIPTHLSEIDLAERLTEILDRVANGEQIVIEREGTAIAVLEPPHSVKKYWTWGDLVHFLQHEASFDEEFAKNVRELRESQPPVRYPEWPE